MLMQTCSAPVQRSPEASEFVVGASACRGAPADLLQLAGWWEAKAAGGLPRRSALDPVEIASHLASVALLDVEEEDFRFRLIGEEVAARYGLLRGRNLRQLLSGDALTDALSEHRVCAESGQPTLAHRIDPTADGSDLRRYWRLLLPFGLDGRTTTILAAMHFEWRRLAR